MQSYCNFSTFSLHNNKDIGCNNVYNVHNSLHKRAKFINLKFMKRQKIINKD